MSDMRSILERGVGGLTPPRHGYERMLRRRDRKRRNQRIRAGIVGLAIAIIGFVTAASVIRSESRPADQSPSPSSSPPSPTEVSGPKFEKLASAGIPSRGIDPSLPQVGILVASFSSETPPRDSAGDPVTVAATLYRDGRIIWHCDPQRCSGLASPADEPDTGFVQQRLSPSGVEAVRSELVATGLLDRSPEVVRFPRYLHIDVPGVGSADSGPYQALGFPPKPTKAQREGLHRAQFLFLSLGSWLPETGWADEDVHAFVPSHYCLWFYPRPPHDPSDLPAPADELMSGKFTELTTDEARAIAAGLDAAGVSAYDRGGVAYMLDLPGRERATWMYLELNLPHGSEC